MRVLHLRREIEREEVGRREADHLKIAERDHVVRKTADVAEEVVVKVKAVMTARSVKTTTTTGVDMREDDAMAVMTHGMAKTRRTEKVMRRRDKRTGRRRYCSALWRRPSDRLTRRREMTARSM